MKRILLPVLAAILAFVAPAQGQIPRTISYQGVLTDAGGAVVADSDYNMTFRLYDAPSEGTALWTEYQLVAVAKGIFNVVLGSDAVLALDFSQQYWLGIAVEAQPELTPRIPLTAAAYSFSSMGVYGSSNVFPSSGNVGIGTTAPNEPLSIVADATPQVALRAGTANSSYSSIYIQAYNGGGRPGYGYVRGGLAAHHYVDTDGAWRLDVDGAERLRVESPGNVGIGVGNPLERLDVDGAVRLGASAGNYAGTIRFTGADFEGYDGSTWKSLTAEGGSGLPAGSLGSTLRHNGSTWEAVQSLYNAGTNIGIGTTSPSAHLEVMGTGTQKIKIETTTSTGTAVVGLESTAGANDNLNLAKYGPSAAGLIGGVPAANLSIAASGLDAGAMLIGTQAARPLHFMTGGTEQIRLDEYGTLTMFNAAHTASMAAYYTAYGHSLNLYDENGVYYNISAQADANGTGGYFAVRSLNDATVRGLFVDGNYNGTQSPRIDIAGAGSNISFNASTDGNGAVVLPNDAISDAEILNEPGVASYRLGSSSVTLTGDAYNIIASRTFTAPSFGYALVIGTCQMRSIHVNGTPTYGEFGVSDVSSTLPTNQDINVQWPGSLPSGTYEFAVTAHGLFTVVEGANTFYLLGFEYTGDLSAYDVQLTLIFLPSSYGTVDPTLAGGADVPDDEAPSRVITAADAERERIASIEADNDRIRREMEQMRAEFERLRAEVSGNRQ